MPLVLNQMDIFSGIKEVPFHRSYSLGMVNVPFHSNLLSGNRVLVTAYSERFF